jgi:hypothetical protein
MKLMLAGRSRLDSSNEIEFFGFRFEDLQLSEFRLVFLDVV